MVPMTHFLVVFVCVNILSLFYVVSDVNECKSNPCVNGECEDKVNGYKCHCLSGWEGTLCKDGQYKDLYLYKGLMVQSHIHRQE